MISRIDSKSFFERCKTKHNNYYTYDETSYVKITDVIIVVCPKHGCFQQIADSHARGYGCSNCRNDNNSLRFRKNKSQFIEQAQQKHGMLYNYDAVDYINTRAEIIITCNKHNITFLQKPSSHLASSTGCPPCQREKVDKHLAAVRKTKEQFIRDCKTVHGNRYDYSLVEYTNNTKKVKIQCRTHGVFEQSPCKHINSATNCPKCAKAAKGMQSRSNTSDFISKSKRVHKNKKYDYSLVQYTTAIRKVTIICDKHGAFEQRPNDHLNGYGCYSCARLGGYDWSYFEKYPDKRSIGAKLYLIKLNHNTQNFIKIGITVRPRLEDRFNFPKHELEILDEYKCDLFEAFKLEQQILQDFKQYKFYPTKLEKQIGGHTECFRLDAEPHLTEKFRNIKNDN